MINASAAFRRALADNHTLLVRGTLRLAGGEEVELSGSDLMAVSMEEATSSDGSFDIGAAVIGSASVTLQNFDARWDAYDFAGASLALWVGKALAGGTTEWLRRGTWWVDQPDSYGGTVELSCLDALSRLEVPWGSAGLAFPATVGEVSEACCRAGGVALDSADFPGHDAAIPATATVPDGSTCLDALRWAAQAAGLFARATPEGRVAMGWYDLSALEGEDWLDGEGFDGGTPSYQSGDDADGGTLADYSMGDRADGGTFDSSRDRPHLYAFSQLTVGTDDVVITGVSVTAQDEATDGGTGSPGGTTLVGSEGYVLSVEGNPLVPYGHDAEVAKRLAARVVGMRFRPLSGTFPSDPTLQAGDAAVVTDRRQNSHRTLLTSVSLTVNGGVRVACSAKSASRNSAERAGAATSAYVAARKDTDRKLSSRDLAIRDLGQRLEDSGGLYHTEETLQDGSTVFFMHDRPTVAESRVIWKMTAEAVAVSTDGGKTYATGLSADGTALLNRIYAIGLDASYINTGELDASNVRIKNLMQIGSDETGLKLSDNNIVFNAFGEESLEISPTTVYPKTIVLKNDDGTPLLKVTGPGSSTYTSDFYPSNPHIGKCHIEPLSDGTGYLAWYSVTLSIYDPKNGGDTVFSKTDTIKMLRTDPTYSADEHVFRIPLYISNTVKISIWFSSAPSTDNTCDSAISVTLSPTGNYLMKLNNATYSTWDSVVGAAIVDKRNDVTFLTNKNYMALLNCGHTYTGSTNIPYVNGNTMRNYLMQFDHGLLSDFKILTPTDPGFVMP